MRYSVSPRVKLNRGGPKPIEKRRTFTPTALANRKCPSSWTKTRAPSRSTKAARFWNSIPGPQVNRRGARSQRARKGIPQQSANRDHVEVHRGRIEQECAHPVEQTPVARDERARILHPVRALEQRLAQVPQGAQHRAEQPSTTQSTVVSAGKATHRAMNIPATEPTAPPAKPSQVLFGLTAG